MPIPAFRAWTTHLDRRSPHNGRVCFFFGGGGLVDEGSFLTLDGTLCGAFPSVCLHLHANSALEYLSVPRIPAP